MRRIIVYTLSLIFALLIIYQVYISFNNPIIEGAANPKYKEYSGDDALILAKQNAGNINFLKQKFDTIDELSKKVSTLSTEVDSNTESIHQILVAQQDQTNKLKGADGS